MKERDFDIQSIKAAFAGDVPLGSGLSSSAAIEAATAIALDALFKLEIDRKDLAVLCQHAENAFVGVNSGIMDQYASLLCQAGSALLIDCRSLEAKPIPLKLSEAIALCSSAILAFHGNWAQQAITNAGRVCERAAHTLGVKELRDARPRGPRKAIR